MPREVVEIQTESTPRKSSKYIFYRVLTHFLWVAAVVVLFLTSYYFIVDSLEVLPTIIGLLIACVLILASMIVDDLPITDKTNNNVDIDRSFQRSEEVF